MSNVVDDRPKQSLVKFFACDALATFCSLPREYQSLVEAIPVEKWVLLSNTTIDQLLRGQMNGAQLKATLKRCGIDRKKAKEILTNANSRSTGTQFT